MFYDQNFDACDSLINLDISNFNTENTYMNNMFLGCDSLKNLNVNNYLFKNVELLKEIFGYGFYYDKIIKK